MLVFTLDLQDCGRKEVLISSAGVSSGKGAMQAYCRRLHASATVVSRSASLELGWVVSQRTVQARIVDVDENLISRRLRVFPFDKARRQLLGLNVLFDHVGFPVRARGKVSAALGRPSVLICSHGCGCGVVENAWDLRAIE